MNTPEDLLEMLKSKGREHELKMALMNNEFDFAIYPLYGAKFRNEQGSYYLDSDSFGTLEVDEEDLDAETIARAMRAPERTVYRLFRCGDDWDLRVLTYEEDEGKAAAEGRLDDEVSAEFIRLSGAASLEDVERLIETGLRMMKEELGET